MGTNARTILTQAIANQGTPDYPPRFENVLHQAHLEPPIKALLEKAYARPALSKAAEAADVIAVTCQLKDLDGNNLSEAREVELCLIDNNGLESLVGAFTITPTTGTAKTTTAKPRLVVESNAAGLVVVDVTDIGGASGLTIHMLARVMSDANRIGGQERLAITFD